MSNNPTIDTSKLKPLPFAWLNPAFGGDPRLQIGPTERKPIPTKSKTSSLKRVENALLAGERLSGTALYRARTELGFGRIEALDQEAKAKKWGAWWTISPSQALGIAEFGKDKFELLNPSTWSLGGAARGTLAFATDIALDPLTWVTVGASELAKIGGKPALKVAGIAIGRRGAIEVGPRATTEIAEMITKGATRKAAEEDVMRRMAASDVFHAEMTRGGEQMIRFGTSTRNINIMRTARITEPLGVAWRAAPYYETRSRTWGTANRLFGSRYYDLTQAMGKGIERTFQLSNRRRETDIALLTQQFRKITKRIPEERIDVVRQAMENPKIELSAEEKGIRGELKKVSDEFFAMQLKEGIVGKEQYIEMYLRHQSTKELRDYFRSDMAAKRLMYAEKDIPEYTRKLWSSMGRTTEGTIDELNAMFRTKGVKKAFETDLNEILAGYVRQHVQALESAKLERRLAEGYGRAAIPEIGYRIPEGAKRRGIVADMQRKINTERLSKKRDIGVAKNEVDIFRAKEVERLKRDVAIAQESHATAISQLEAYPKFIEPEVVPRRTKAAVTAKSDIDRLIKESEALVARHPEATRYPKEDVALQRILHLTSRNKAVERFHQKYRGGATDIEVATREALNRYGEKIKIDWANKQAEYTVSSGLVGEFSDVLFDIEHGLKTSLPDIPPTIFTPKELEKYLSLKENLGVFKAQKSTPSGLTRFIDRATEVSRRRKEALDKAEAILKNAERKRISIHDLPTSEYNKLSTLKRKIAERGSEEEYVVNEMKKWDVKGARAYTQRIKGYEKLHSTYLSLTRQIESKRKILYEGTRELTPRGQIVAKARKEYEKGLAEKEFGVSEAERAITAAKEELRAQPKMQSLLETKQRNVLKTEQKYQDWGMDAESRMAKAEVTAYAQKVKGLPSIRQFGEEELYLYKMASGKQVYFPKPIAEELLKPMHRYITQAGHPLHPLEEKYIKAETTLKKSLTVIWPAFFARNIQGGMFQNYLEGVGTSDYYRSWDILMRTSDWKIAQGIRKIAGISDTKLYDIPLMGKKTAREMRDIMERQDVVNTVTGRIDVPLSEIQGNGATGTLGKAWNWVWNKYPETAMTGTEAMVRSPLFMHELYKGKTIEAAELAVGKTHFRYGAHELTDFENTAMKRLLPFWTWARWNIRRQTEMVIRKPGKYATMFKAQERVVSEDERARMPDWMREKLGFAHGKTFVGVDLPIGEMPGLYGMKDVAFGISPMIKYPIGVLSGREFGTGRPVGGLTDVGFMLSSLLPRASYAKKELSKNVAGERPLSWTAAHQFGGVGVYEMRAGGNEEAYWSKIGKKPGWYPGGQEEYESWKTQEGWKPRLTEQGKFALSAQLGDTDIFGTPCNGECVQKHIVPIGIGGSNTLSNMALVHPNNLHQFEEYMQPMAIERARNPTTLPDITAEDKYKFRVNMNEYMTNTEASMSLS